MPAIILESIEIQKRYGVIEALRGVSLQVEEGEMFGLLGPNGAGKTTLLSILSCLLEPTAGSARLFGRPLTRSDMSLRPLIGLCPQDLALYSDLTARENLAFFGELYGLRGKALELRVDEVLEFTALRDRANDRVATFSGGMKRRLNLGVAVVHRPKVLYLDEPTTGVDPQSRHHLFQEIRTLNAAGTTVVYTSHYMEEVQTLCPRIAILDHGKVIACDLRQNLLRLLDGTLVARMSGDVREVVQRIENLPDLNVVSAQDDAIEISSPDVNAAMLRIVALLREMNVELTGLEVKEPTLEQVFLHLTDAAVRD